MWSRAASCRRWPYTYRVGNVTIQGAIAFIFKGMRRDGASAWDMRLSRRVGLAGPVSGCELRPFLFSQAVLFARRSRAAFVGVPACGARARKSLATRRASAREGFCSCCCRWGAVVGVPCKGSSFAGKPQGWGGEPCSLLQAWCPSPKNRGGARSAPPRLLAVFWQAAGAQRSGVLWPLR